VTPVSQAVICAWKGGIKSRDGVLMELAEYQMRADTRASSHSFMFHMKHNQHPGGLGDYGRRHQLERTMTHQSQDMIGLIGAGPRFELALDELLSAAVELLATLTEDDEADHSIRFRAEAPTREALVSECLNAVMTRIIDFDAHPLVVALEGVRLLEGGYRAWGSVFVDLDRSAPRQRFHVLSDPTIRDVPDHCDISVSVAMTQWDCDYESTRVD
jgi:hypothetical protein